QFPRQLGDDPDASRLSERRQHVRQVRWMDGLRAVQELAEVVLLGELLQLIESQVRTSRRIAHVVPGPPALPPAPGVLAAAVPNAIVRTGPGRTATRSTRVALAARTSNSRPLYMNRSPARGMRPSAWISSPPTLCAPLPSGRPSLSASSVVGVLPSTSTTRVVSGVDD